MDSISPVLNLENIRLTLQKVPGKKWTAFSPLLILEKFQTKVLGKNGQHFPLFWTQKINQNAVKSSWEKMDSIFPSSDWKIIRIKMQQRIPGKILTAFSLFWTPKLQKWNCREGSWPNIHSIFPQKSNSQKKVDGQKLTAFPLLNPKIPKIKFAEKVLGQKLIAFSLFWTQ